MRYGDVLFVENSKLGEIEGIIAMIGIEKSMQKSNLSQMSFEDYSNEQMLAGPTESRWMSMTQEECEEEWKNEMDSRAEAAERSQERVDELRQELKAKLDGMDYGAVSHFLSERQKTYEADRAKAEVPLEKIDAQAQIEATIDAKNIVKVLEAKTKQN